MQVWENFNAGSLDTLIRCNVVLNAEFTSSCIAFRGFAGDDRELRDCERTRGRDLHAGSVRSDVCAVLGAACKEESHRRRVGRLINPDGVSNFNSYCT